MTTMLRSCCILLCLVSVGAADQYSFTNNGGSVTLGSNLVLSGSNVGTPAGTVNFTCPITGYFPGTYELQWTCAGGSFSLQSSDGTTSANGAFTSGLFIMTASGGGRGGHITYWYSFSGNFSGSLTQGGQQEAITGYTAQALDGLTNQLGTGTIGNGITVINSTYEPVYITDTYNNRIIRIDDMTGDNWVTLGKSGSGVKQFSQPWGIFLDSAGKIYVTDYANCRVVRVDDMTGANWTALGTCGAGNNQFNNPTGIAVDAAGKIYVADSGNNRLVRMDNMSGANWTSYGTQGTGAGFLTGPAGVAVNAAGQIFISDSGNSQIVRIDDMTGTNYTALGGFSSPQTISLDAAGRIYVADVYNNRIVRTDDMVGTNWTVLGSNSSGSTTSFINPYGAFVDQFGTIYVADSRDYRIVRSDDMNGLAWTTYATGGTGVGQVDSPSGLYAAPPAVPTPVPLVSAASLSFGDQVVGLTTAAQGITLANIGNAPLNVTSLSPSGDFAETDNCVGALAAGSSCGASVTFTPTVGGTRTGSLAVNFATPAPKTVSLTGIGTLVAVAPTSLNFGNVRAGDGKGSSLTVTISNPGANSAGITSVVLKAPPAFKQKSTCSATLASGSSCTVTVTFKPAAVKLYSGKLTITDGSGTKQVVTMTGVGFSN